MSEQSVFRPRRSVLYLPANNLRAVEKAKTLPVDALIFDLEDSVAPGEKVSTRKQMVQALSAGGFGRRERVVRINDLENPWGLDDLAAAASVVPDAILLPKVNEAGDIAKARDALRAAGGTAATQFWCMMETPRALLNVQAIAAAGHAHGLSCFVCGTNDLIKETRVSATHGRRALLPWLSQVVLAARAYGLDVVDGVYNDFSDKTGFVVECEQGRDLGMDGKTLIHPMQIEPCNTVFSPSEAEVEWSRKVIAAFALPENESRGVITVDGKMVERLHLAMAQRVAVLAAASTP